MFIFQFGSNLNLISGVTPKPSSNFVPFIEMYGSRSTSGVSSRATPAAGGSVLVLAATLNLSIKAYFIPVCAALAVLSNACVVLVLRRRRLVKVWWVLLCRFVMKFTRMFPHKSTSILLTAVNTIYKGKIALHTQRLPIKL